MAEDAPEWITRKVKEDAPFARSSPEPEQSHSASSSSPQRSSGEFADHDHNDWSHDSDDASSFDVLSSESSLFRPILCDEDARRQSAVTRAVEALLEAAKSVNTNPDSRKFIELNAPTAVRFAYEAPFSDIRHPFLRLITTLEEQYSIRMPKPPKAPSRFADPNLFVDIEPEDERIRSSFQSFFLESGRVPHYARVMYWHSSYSGRFFETYNHICRAGGPLPPPWRHYIAILASARYNCEYLIRFQESEFLNTGGDPVWLKGVSSAPRKLQNLLQFNALLAHQPWLLTKGHVEALVKGADAWSIAELMQAIIIMCTFHALCGFVFGAGITAEVDVVDSRWGGSQEESDSFSLDDHRSASINEETNQLIAHLKEDDEDEETDAQENARVFEKSAAESDQLTTPPSQAFSVAAVTGPTPPPIPGMDYVSGGDRVSSSSSSSSSSPYMYSSALRSPSSSSSASSFSDPSSSTPHSSYASRYENGYTLRYSDFDVKSKEYKIFSVQEYCWKDQVYSLISRFAGDTAALMDEEFDFIYSMTDNQFNQVQNVNTTRFREAIWYYVGRLYGMLYDDYNYRHVNTFVNRLLKLYIKKTACHPEEVLQKDFINMGYSLRPDEKIHITLLTVEARKQCCITYAVHALQKYLT